MSLDVFFKTDISAVLHAVQVAYEQARRYQPVTDELSEAHYRGFTDAIESMGQAFGIRGISPPRALPPAIESKTKTEELDQFDREGYLFVRDEIDRIRKESR